MSELDPGVRLTQIETATAEFRGISLTDQEWLISRVRQLVAQNTRLSHAFDAISDILENGPESVRRG